MRTLHLKLDPGTDLRLSLEAYGLNNVKKGFVLGVIGDLTKATFQCPGRPKPTVLEGPLEIITLNGTISSSGVHLHLSLSDYDCQVWGGHLEPGTIIKKSAEILVGSIENNFTDKFPSQIQDNSLTARVEIAVLPECPWSKRAIRILNSSDIPFNIRMIDNDQDYQAIKKISELTTFPQVFIDGVLLGGYDELSSLYKSGNLSDYG